MGTIADSENPDEMPHYVAFHQGLHCLIRQNQSLEKDFLKIFSSIYTMGYPDLTVLNFMEGFIDLKMVTRFQYLNVMIINYFVFLNKI